MKKRLLSLILAIIMIISLFPTATFAEETDTETTGEAVDDIAYETGVGAVANDVLDVPANLYWKDESTATLAWDAVSGANYYEIEVIVSFESAELGVTSTRTADNEIDVQQEINDVVGDTDCDVVQVKCRVQALFQTDGVIMKSGEYSNWTKEIDYIVNLTGITELDTPSILSYDEVTHELRWSEVEYASWYNFSITMREKGEKDWFYISGFPIGPNDLGVERLNGVCAKDIEQDIKRCMKLCEIGAEIEFQLDVSAYPDSDDYEHTSSGYSGNSEWFEYNGIIPTKLKTPTIISYDEATYKLSWTDVDNAYWYYVNFYTDEEWYPGMHIQVSPYDAGVEYTNGVYTKDLGEDIKNCIKNSGIGNKAVVYHLSVMAEPDSVDYDHICSDYSDWTDWFDYELVLTKLASPKILSYDEATHELSWTEVENTYYYEFNCHIKVEGQEGYNGTNFHVFPGAAGVEYSNRVFTKNIEQDIKDCMKTCGIGGEIEFRLNVGAHSSSFDYEHIDSDFSDCTDWFEYPWFAKVEKIHLSEGALAVATGNTITLGKTVEPENAYYKSIDWTSSVPAIAEVDNLGNVTGKAVGKSEITAKIDDVTDTVTVYVYNVERPEIEDITGGSDEESGEIIKDTTEGKIEDVINDEDTAGTDIRVEDLQNIKAKLYHAFENGGKIYVEESVKKKDYDEAYYEEVWEQITEVIQEGTCAGVYDITVGVHTTEEAEALFNLTEFPEEIPFIIQIPDNLPTVEEGKTRHFTLVRYHDGQVDIIPYESDNNGNLFAKSDKFSEYSLFYSDYEDDALIIDSGTCGDNLIWTLNEDGILTISGTGAMYDYSFSSIVPPGVPPWNGNDSIKSIIIENGVTTIGSCAFIGCGATSISMPSSLVKIGDAAFTGSSLTSVIIPDSVTDIGTAFTSCNHLTSLTIPSSVKSISDGAFGGCTKLEAIRVDNGNRYYKSADGVLFNYEQTKLICYPGNKAGENYAIPSTVTSIADSAFSFCSGLTSVEIPASVTSIGEYAFDSCDNLTDVYYAGTEVQRGNISIATGNESLLNATWQCKLGGKCGDNLTWTLDEKGILTISGTGAMYDYEIGTAPWYRQSITSIIIEDGVSTLGDYAFAHCLHLYSISIPSSVRTIGNGSFLTCISLTSVTIPPSITKIGSKAFAVCERLVSIDIPASVTTIGDNLFSGCISLISIYVADDNAFFKSIDGVLFNYAQTELIAYPAAKPNEKYTVPSSAKRIGNWAFDGCDNLTTVVIPSSVTSIGEAAFYSCSSLADVSIPLSVCSIGNNAFALCENLNSITIPVSVSNIGDNTFELCSGLTEIKIPNSVTSIGQYAFRGCYSLASVTIPDCVTTIGEGAFDYCNLTDVYYAGTEVQRGNISIATGNESLLNAMWHCKPGGKCGDNLTWTLDEKGILTISGTGAMTNCGLGGYPWSSKSSDITKILIDDSVTSIGDYAFYYCTRLTSVTIPNSVTSIGNSAFQSCSSLTSVTIPDRVTSIGNCVFSSCSSLMNVTIPDSVTIIGTYAFYGCHSLTSMTIPDSVTSIGDSAFQSCSSLTSVTIPDSVTSIADNTFSECTGLKSMTIPDSVTSIGDYAFYCCTSLMSVMIHSSVTSIGNCAFQSCSSLTSVTIPDSVTSIGDHAFYVCPSLTDVYYSGTETQRRSISIGASNNDLIHAAWHCKPDPITLSGIEITKAPSKTAYTVGESFAPAGMVVTASYSNSTTEPVTGYTYDPNGKLAITDTKVTITYQGKTADVTITVSKKFGPDAPTTVSGVACTTVANNDGKITGVDSTMEYKKDSDSNWTAITGTMVTDLSNGTYEVRVKETADTEAGKSATVIVGVYKAPTQSSIDITKAPDKTVYTEGETFDKTGMIVTAIYSDGTSKTVTDYSFSPSEALKTSDTSITVTYEGKTATQTITVTAKHVHSFSTGWTSDADYHWHAATCEHTSEVSDKAEHSWNEGVISKVATHLEEGEKTFTCTVCGKTKTDVIPKEAAHTYTEKVVSNKYKASDANCTEAAKYYYSCKCGEKGEATFTDGEPLGHSFSTEWSYDDTYHWHAATCEHTSEVSDKAAHSWNEGVITKEATATEEGVKSFTCTVCGKTKTEPVEKIDSALTIADFEEKGLSAGQTLYADGKPVTIDANGSITLPNDDAKSLVAYAVNDGNETDIHKVYPTDMKVWMIEKNGDGSTTAKYVDEFDGLLQYAGCSIRFTDNKGIRMISAIDKAKKNALANSTLAGYSLVEYGTLLCKKDEMENGSLTLSDSYARSNYAYKKSAGADPVFKDTGSTIQFTNVLVGFTLEQCKLDLAMRPYIKLADANGNEITIYGGTVYRSIGYIAYQNRNSFAPGTDAYAYIWEIIHSVYGDVYDSEYKG